MVSDVPWEGSQFGHGSRIGKYVLEKQIGHGGMAVVFRARDDQLGRPVALKIMAPSVAADAEFQQRFVRESKAAAAVDDPHIIPLFEAGEVGWRAVHRNAVRRRRRRSIAAGSRGSARP